mmetsp:Transcript_58971/g.179881  ORF Transcript_58971/g.179881 Transcript_58971/m.179881 type:complete len:218 (+) Transcript_58971:2284-2937(+)
MLGVILLLISDLGCSLARETSRKMSSVTFPPLLPEARRDQVEHSLGLSQTELLPHLWHVFNLQVAGVIIGEVQHSAVDRCHSFALFGHDHRHHHVVQRLHRQAPDLTSHLLCRPGRSLVGDGLFSGLQLLPPLLLLGFLRLGLLRLGPSLLLGLLSLLRLLFRLLGQLHDLELARKRRVLRRLRSRHRHRRHWRRRWRGGQPHTVGRHRRRQGRRHE